MSTLFLTRLHPDPVGWFRRLGLGQRLLIMAVLLFALWYTWPTPAPMQVESVAREYITEKHPSIRWGPVMQHRGRLGNHRVIFQGDRDGEAASGVVHLASSASGPQVTSVSIILGTFSQLPMRLAQTLVVMVLFVIVFFRAIPQTFGRKCPRHDTLLPITETFVVPPQHDKKLVTLPAIIERVWTCPQCDFRHVEALPDPMHKYWPPAVPAKESREDALARAITKEQYDEQLAQIRQRAAEATSRDSPWRSQ